MLYRLRHSLSGIVMGASQMHDIVL